jgi:hypothetical protein
VISRQRNHRISRTTDSDIGQPPAHRQIELISTGAMGTLSVRDPAPGRAARLGSGIGARAWLPAIVAAKRHLGHSSIVVTMDRYGHLFPSEDAALAERLDKAFRESQTDRRRTDSSTNTVRIVP